MFATSLKRHEEPYRMQAVNEAHQLVPKATELCPASIEMSKYSMHRKWRIVPATGDGTLYWCSSRTAGAEKKYGDKFYH